MSLKNEVAGTAATLLRYAQELCRKTRDPDGANIFHYICAYDLKESLKYTLNNCSQELTENTNYYGFTPLDYIVREQSFEALRLIREIKPSLIKTETDQKSTLAHQCMLGGFFFNANTLTLKVTQSLCTLYPEMWKKRDIHGKTPLHILVESALSSNQFLAVKQSLKEKYFKETLIIKDLKGNTPLHIAFHKGQIELIKELYDLDHTLFAIKNNRGETPLFLLQKCSYSLISFFLKKDLKLFEQKDNQYNSPLHHFMITHHSIKTFKQFKPPHQHLFKAKNSNGNNLLHLEMKSPQIEKLHFFITNFKELLKQKNKEGLTPIEFAAKNGYLKALQLYEIKFPEKLKTLSQDYPELLHNACLSQNLDLIQFLSSHFKITTLDKNKNSYLHLLAKVGFIDGLNYFLTDLKGLKLSLFKENKGKRTPLNEALYFKQLHILEYFFKLISKKSILKIISSPKVKELYELYTLSEGYKLNNEHFNDTVFKKVADVSSPPDCTLDKNLIKHNGWNDLITSIQKRHNTTGVPKDRTAKTTFYDTIENALKHIVHAYEKDTKLLPLILKCAESGYYCGTRRFDDIMLCLIRAREQEFKNSKELSSLDLNKLGILLELHGKRQNIFQYQIHNVLRIREAIDAHLFHSIGNTVGKKFGLLFAKNFKKDALTVKISSSQLDEIETRCFKNYSLFFTLMSIYTYFSDRRDTLIEFVKKWKKTDNLEKYLSSETGLLKPKYLIQYLKKIHVIKKST